MINLIAKVNKYELRYFKKRQFIDIILQLNVEEGRSFYQIFQKTRKDEFLHSKDIKSTDSIFVQMKDVISQKSFKDERQNDSRFKQSHFKENSENLKNIHCLTEKIKNENLSDTKR